jgi:hypothetical protein
MLSAPVRSAKRISSLFSLGSNKDGSLSSSPNSPSFPKHSPDQCPEDAQQRPRSSSRPARLVSNPQSDYSDTRSIRTTGPIDQLDLDEPLPPPPSLLAVNQDLATSANNAPDGRPQSRGRPSSAGGLLVPGTGPDSRPGTPSKRRSWIPGRARASSVDARPQNTTSQMPSAWIAGLDQKILYDVGPLVRGEQVCRLSVPALRPSTRSGLQSPLIYTCYYRFRNCGMKVVTLMSICSPKTLDGHRRSKSIQPSSRNHRPSHSLPGAQTRAG